MKHVGFPAHAPLWQQPKLLWQQPVRPTASCPNQRRRGSASNFRAKTHARLQAIPIQTAKKKCASTLPASLETPHSWCFLLLLPQPSSIVFFSSATVSHLLRENKKTIKSGPAHPFFFSYQPPLSPYPPIELLPPSLLTPLLRGSNPYTLRRQSKTSHSLAPPVSVAPTTASAVPRRSRAPRSGTDSQLLKACILDPEIRGVRESEGKKREITHSAHALSICGKAHGQ